MNVHNHVKGNCTKCRDERETEVFFQGVLSGILIMGIVSIFVIILEVL